MTVDPLCIVCTPGLCCHGEQSVTPDEIETERKIAAAVSAERKSRHTQELVIDDLRAERDGAVAAMAAAKRERGVLRIEHQVCKAIRELAVIEEREACAEWAEFGLHADADAGADCDCGGCKALRIAAARIRARPLH